MNRLILYLFRLILLVFLLEITPLEGVSARNEIIMLNKDLIAYTKDRLEATCGMDDAEISAYQRLIGEARMINISLGLMQEDDQSYFISSYLVLLYGLQKLIDIEINQGLTVKDNEKLKRLITLINKLLCEIRTNSYLQLYLLPSPDMIWGSNLVKWYNDMKTELIRQEKQIKYYMNAGAPLTFLDIFISSAKNGVDFDYKSIVSLSVILDEMRIYACLMMNDMDKSSDVFDVDAVFLSSILRLIYNGDLIQYLEIEKKNSKKQIEGSESEG